MADEDDERAKSGHPEWKETCIGIWTRSTRKESVDGEERSKICNGISVVKLKKDVDPKSIKLSKTRGIQIVVQEVEGKQDPNTRNPSSESPSKDSSSHPKEINDENDMMLFRRRVMDVMLKKKSNLEENLEHYRSGVNPTDVWTGLQDTVSRWYKTSTRLLSYCKPQDKLYEVYNFVSSRVKSVGSRWNSKSDDDTKKK